MGDFENVVIAARNAQNEGREIDDATARTIASMYHEGQASVSYSFASTGYIANRTEVYCECFRKYDALTDDGKLVANMFGTYLMNRQSTEVVPGWSRLWVAG